MCAWCESAEHSPGEPLCRSCGHTLAALGYVRFVDRAPVRRGFRRWLVQAVEVIEAERRRPPHV